MCVRIGTIACLSSGQPVYPQDNRILEEPLHVYFVQSGFVSLAIAVNRQH